MVNKKRWVEIMVAAGFGEEEMTKWHQKFEELEPLEHQKFLESLERVVIRFTVFGMRQRSCRYCC